MKKDKLIAMGATALLVLSLTGIGYYQSSNKELSSLWNHEKQKKEQLDSENVRLTNQITGLKSKETALSTQNSELTESLKGANENIQQRDKKIQMMNKEMTDYNALKKNYKNSVAERTSLSTRVADLERMNATHKNERDQLNNTLASIREENIKLKQNNEILASLTAADNFRVESMRKKDRLTVVAKRTRKMNVSFEVPNNVAGNVSFTIIRPDGVKVSSNDKSIVYRIVDEGKDLTTATTRIAPAAKMKKVEMNYQPKEKLPSGIYKIEIRNGDKKITTCQIRLR